jgi:DNA-binding CsgD family transcriptional regulator
MPVPIPLDHPTILLKPKIQEACKSFLETFGFNYFQYLRCFADGSVGLLTNNTSIMEHFHQIDNEPVVFSSFEENQANAHSYWFLWDEALPAKPVELVREKFNIRHGLTLVRRNQNYYDMIAVALPHEQSNSFYLNKLAAIEHFINDFDKNNKDLIELMHKNPIALPEPYRDVNYKEICLTNGKLRINGQYGETYVTTQELGCLRLLAQGTSYKEIARFLDISPRTVETYLQRVKIRTGYSSLLEIIRLISFCP